MTLVNETTLLAHDFEQCNDTDGNLVPVFSKGNVTVILDEDNLEIYSEINQVVDAEGELAEELGDPVIYKNTDIGIEDLVKLIKT